MLEERFERVTTLAKINSTHNYLEIGVSSGKTFRNVVFPHKVAVDPKIKFKLDSTENQKVFLHETTSDNFFSNIANQHPPFDLIFVDGLHTFEQTFRDFCASLAHSHSRTIWLIDDTVPHNWVEANPNTKIVGAIRTLFRTKGTLWMGDVYKLIFMIHDFFPQFSYATFEGHGQTVVWCETRKDFQPTWNSLKKISQLSFNDFKKFKKSHLNIMDAAQIIKAIENSANHAKR